MESPYLPAAARTDSSRVSRSFTRANRLLTNGQVDELLLSSSFEQNHSADREIDAVNAPEIPDLSGGTASNESRTVSLPEALINQGSQLAWQRQKTY